MANPVDHVDQVMEQWRTERPELNVSSTGVLGRLYRYHGMVEKQMAQVYKQFGLNLGEFDVLATLRRNNRELTPTELMASLMLSSGAMTNRLDRLEKAGWITRQHSAEDRRSVRVSLTAEGRALIDDLMPEHLDGQDSILAALSPDEQDQLALLLKKALTAF